MRQDGPTRPDAMRGTSLVGPPAANAELTGRGFATHHPDISPTTTAVYYGSDEPRGGMSDEPEPRGVIL